MIIQGRLRDFILKNYTLMNQQMCILIQSNMNSPADVPKSTFAGSFEGKKSSKLFVPNEMLHSIDFLSHFYPNLYSDLNLLEQCTPTSPFSASIIGYS